ncbi:MAG TPA: cellulase family glycosylhydrolase [Caulifigura sp.]|nr:cellulase family glycosylhydrolase [Caulifigura sp.]
MFNRRSLLAFALTLAITAPAFAQTRSRWTTEEAAAWREGAGWLVGANFSPAYAINQLEMWQADTFDLKAIDRELQWAEDLGMNSMRVFLHHLLWEQDSKGLLERMNQFLHTADKHKIRVMFVLFDSVWDPHPQLGKQRPPKQGLHNSGWVQSPGAKDLTNPERHRLLEAYTKGVISHFKDDPRVVVWDLWNEPDNPNDNSYGKNGSKTEPAGKVQITADLLKKTFAWARSVGPSQPLTSGLWIKDRAVNPSRMIPIEHIQLEESDIISFHSYGALPEMKLWVAAMKSYKRPISCTEYMARPMQSTFDPILGYLKDEGIDAYNWGFVQGKTNTIYPWDSWKKAYDQEPPRWFHDIFRTDGTPYDPKEVEYIKKTTKGATKQPLPK